MPNFSSGASGALSGAATGASIGGPWGAVAGGVLGGIGGLFGNKKKKKKKISSLDERQQRLNEQQHQAILGQGPLADLYNYDPEAANDVFEKNVANPEYRNLNEQGIPALTGQFRSNGLMNSSYAGDAVGKLIRNVQEKLAGERSKYLYGEQQDARTAKRNAVEGLQNRQTFAYDQAAPSRGGFDINSILSSISPDMIGGVSDYFKKPTGVR